MNLQVKMHRRESCRKNMISTGILHVQLARSGFGCEFDFWLLIDHDIFSAGLIDTISYDIAVDETDKLRTLGWKLYIASENVHVTAHAHLLSRLWNLALTKILRVRIPIMHLLALSSFRPVLLLQTLILTFLSVEIGAWCPTAYPPLLHHLLVRARTFFSTWRNVSMSEMPPPKVNNLDNYQKSPFVSQNVFRDF